MYHAWEVLTSGSSSESCDFGLYPYVIFTRSADASGTLREATRQRYVSLLSAITTSTPTPDQASAFDRKLTNIFYVPSRKSRAQGGSQFENYDIGIARDVVSVLLKGNPDKAFSESLLFNPGPFLVSRTFPVYRDCVDSDTYPGALFVDLSRQHPDSMLEVVTAYKKYTMNKGIRGYERFSSIRLELLNLLLSADEAVRLIRSAAADVLGEEGASPEGD
jgi:hypothetical protein